MLQLKNGRERWGVSNHALRVVSGGIGSLMEEALHELLYDKP